MNKKTSWSTTIIIATFLIISLYHKYKVDKPFLGYYLLGLSIMIMLVGVVASFSKKERERAKQKALADLPERASLIDTPDADKKAKRNGYIALLTGIILFVIWLSLYGFSSLAMN